MLILNTTQKRHIHYSNVSYRNVVTHWREKFWTTDGFCTVGSVNPKPSEQEVYTLLDQAIPNPIPLNSLLPRIYDNRRLICKIDAKALKQNLKDLILDKETFNACGLTVKNEVGSFVRIEYETDEWKLRKTGSLVAFHISVLQNALAKTGVKTWHIYVADNQKDHLSPWMFDANDERNTSIVMPLRIKK